MGMLGGIHRAVLGQGPEQVRKHFVKMPESVHSQGRNNLRRHNLQLQTFRQDKFLDILAHSILGLIDVYNLLHQDIVDHKCVHAFQKALHRILKTRIHNGDTQWDETFSPRIPLHLHPLREYIKVCTADETPVTQLATGTGGGDIAVPIPRGDHPLAWR